MADNAKGPRPAGDDNGAADRARWPFGVCIVVLIGGGVFAYAVGRARSHLANEQAPRDGYVGSSECQRCHEDHYESWYRTFHRTMTQEANASVANFEDGTANYRGWSARMVTENEERVVITRDPSGTETRALVDRVVGSHRYQQLLERTDDVWERLPWAWDIEDQRWFHMNGAFLTPDPPGIASETDHTRHITRWNDNCVFCHNVAPNPGAQPDGSFRTEVAELGIACEACHGPGGEHAEANRMPWRRYALQQSDAGDPTVVSPARLSASRSADVCGRCHGQRMTGDIDEVLAHGDPFIPGDDLARHSEPLWADSTLNERAVFAARFWEDGAPRLTAYEYQGWLQAACTQQSELTCTTCHGMHDGDPAGQLRPAGSGSASGDESCAHCHSMAADHSRHEDIACVDCHMPRTVYGVLDAHRSHRIDVPRSALSADRPGACTLCHLDQSVGGLNRAITSFSERDVEWRFGAAGTPVGWELAFGGDPIQRALAAHAYGAHDPSARGTAVLQRLVQADPYPAVRIIADRALRARGEASADPMAMERSVEADTRWLPSPELSKQLTSRAQHAAIEIGE